MKPTYSTPPPASAPQGLPALELFFYLKQLGSQNVDTWNVWDNPSLNISTN
jgi:hypothetical protein